MEEDRKGTGAFRSLERACIWTCACVCVCVCGIELHGAGCWSVARLSDDARVLSGVCHPMQRVLTIDFRDKKEKSVAFPALHVRAALSLSLSRRILFSQQQPRGVSKTTGASAYPWTSLVQHHVRMQHHQSLPRASDAIHLPLAGESSNAIVLAAWTIITASLSVASRFVVIKSWVKSERRREFHVDDSPALWTRDQCWYRGGKL